MGRFSSKQIGEKAAGFNIRKGTNNTMIDCFISLLSPLSSLHRPSLSLLSRKEGKYECRLSRLGTAWESSADEGGGEGLINQTCDCPVCTVWTIIFLPLQYSATPIHDRVPHVTYTVTHVIYTTRAKYVSYFIWQYSSGPADCRVCGSAGLSVRLVF